MPIAARRSGQRGAAWSLVELGAPNTGLLNEVGLRGTQGRQHWVRSGPSKGVAR